MVKPGASRARIEKSQAERDRRIADAKARALRRTNLRRFADWQRAPNRLRQSKD